MQSDDRSMKIAILETGLPPARLIDRFGRYPDMFARLLGQEVVGRSYDVARGEYPDRAESHEAYLVTGSDAGTYDDRPWIEPLKGFLNEAKGKAKLVGICFGHQIMAEAFGGRVVKSDKGLGVGMQEYEVAPADWIDGPPRVAVPVWHQDQVVEQPPASRVIAGNDFCPIGGLAYADQPAISFQFHPEFEPEFMTAMIALEADELADAAAAAASLRAPNDSARVGRWIRNFVLG
jgi:GMP synthase-like glutamine amidotransferase